MDRAFLAALLSSLLILGAPSPVGAQQLLQRPARPIAAALPDLVVDDARLHRQCRVGVQVRNDGPGAVPDAVWTRHHPKSAGIHLTRDGASWGGATIWKLDPARGLQPRGGKATYVSTLHIEGTATVVAQVDQWNDVREAGEANNRRSERLTCQGRKRGDLTVRIFACPPRVSAGEELDSRIKVQTRSTFPGPLSAVALDLVLTSSPTYAAPAPYAVYSSGYSDGVLLKGGREHVDFAGRGLLGVALNGTDQIPVDTPAGRYFIGAVIDAGNKVAESDEANNARFCAVQVLGR